MILSHNNRIIVSGNKLLNYEPPEAPIFNPIQILINPDFTEMETDVSPLGWESNVNFVTHCSTGCANDINPSIRTISNSLTFGRTDTPIVYQEVIINNINQINNFDLEYFFGRRNSSRTAQQYVLLRFLDINNNVVIDKRDPVSGTISTPSTDTTSNLILSRGEINNFNDIHKVRVELHGRQEPYVWGGHYGTQFFSVHLNVT